jgi:hypothetical protein
MKRVGKQWMPQPPDQAKRQDTATWRAATLWQRAYDPERKDHCWAYLNVHVTLRPGESHEIVLDRLAPDFAPLQRRDLALVELL